MSLKKEFFAAQRALRWGYVGPPTLSWEKICKKKIFFNRKGNNRNTDLLCKTSIPTFNIPHIISSINTGRAQCAKKKLTIQVRCLLKLLKKMAVVPTTFLNNATEV